MYDLPLSLNCAQDGRESCPVTVPHRVSERNLLGRKRSKQCVNYVTVSCVSHFRWPSYLTAVGIPLALFKFSVMKWLSELMKNASVIAQGPQNPSRHLRILTPLHFQQRCYIVEHACEISFPLLRCPSVPCWQHKRIGKWKLCLRKTPSRRKACIFLCLIVPWTLLEKTMAVCQRICQTALQHGPQWRWYEHCVLWLPSAWNTKNLCRRRRVCLHQIEAKLSLQMRNTVT